MDLKRSRGSDGTVLPGLWENEIVRMELVEGVWHVEVPMREIARTNHFEFRPLTLGGKWHRIGTVKTRKSACLIAECMHAGTHVYAGGHQTEHGPVPGLILHWADVAEEIAAHPSVRGE